MMPTYPEYRVNVMSNGKDIVSATLQQRTGVEMVDGVLHESWEDIRPLEVLPDGKVVLSRTTEEEQEEATAYFTQVIEKARVQ